MTKRLGWILFFSSFFVMFQGLIWLGWGLLLLNFAMFLLDAIADGEQDEKNRKYEEERLARLYPEEAAKKKREQEALEIKGGRERKEAVILAGSKRQEDHKRAIEEFERYYLRGSW